MKTVAFSKAALKALRRMPADQAKRIREKIAQYAENPAELVNNVVRLQGAEGAFRLRVGDWRVIFTDDGEIIAIVRIAPRGGAYD